MKGRRAACDAAPHDDDLGLDHGASDAGYPAMHVTSPPARLALDMTARDTYGAPYSSGGGRSMIPAAFEYHAPTSIIEASALLARLGEDAKILSGGQSLIPLMKLRLANPHHLVDINGIPGLSFIREAEGFLRIGALTRESDLDESELIRTRYPLIHDTSQVIADPVVRNLATIGGNLAHADPANDHPAAMLAAGAEIVAAGRGASAGSRSSRSSPGRSRRRSRPTRSSPRSACPFPRLGAPAPISRWSARSVTSPRPRSPFRSPSPPTTSARGSASGSPTWG